LAFRKEIWVETANKVMLKYFVLLGLVVSTTWACTTTQTNAGNNNISENTNAETEVVESLEIDPSESPSTDEFREIDMQSFQERYNLTTITPQAVGMDLFERFAGGDEGRSSESLTIEYPSWDTALVMVTIIGLADDSVNAERFRIEFERNEQEWDMVSVGSQYRCQPGRGQQDWGTDLCS
jgi:hypothetical protein